MFWVPTSTRSAVVYGPFSSLMGYPGGGGGGGALWSIFAGYVLPVSQSPYHIIVYCMANYRPHLSHFCTNVIYFVNFCLCIYLIKLTGSVNLNDRIHVFFQTPRNKNLLTQNTENDDPILVSKRKPSPGALLSVKYLCKNFFLPTGATLTSWKCKGQEMLFVR